MESLLSSSLGVPLEPLVFGDDRVDSPPSDGTDVSGEIDAILLANQQQQQAPLSLDGDFIDADAVDYFLRDVAVAAEGSPSSSAHGIQNQMQQLNLHGLPISVKEEPLQEQQPFIKQEPLAPYAQLPALEPVDDASMQLDGAAQDEIERQKVELQEMEAALANMEASRPARRPRSKKGALTAEERAQQRAEANKASAAASRERRKVLVAKLRAEEAVLSGEQKALKKELKHRRIENSVLQNELQSMLAVFASNPMLSSLLAAQRDAQNGAAEAKMPEEFQKMLKAIELPSHLPAQVPRVCQTSEEQEMSKAFAGLYLRLALATHLSRNGSVPVGTPPYLEAAAYATAGIQLPNPIPVEVNA
jgi:hypothetical protein